MTQPARSEVRARHKRLESITPPPFAVTNLAEMVSHVYRDAEIEELRAALAAKDAEIAALREQRKVVPSRGPRWADLYLTAMESPRWVTPMCVHLDALELDDAYQVSKADADVFLHLVALGLVERHPDHVAYSLTDAGRDWVERQRTH